MIRCWRLGGSTCHGYTGQVCTTASLKPTAPSCGWKATSGSMGTIRRVKWNCIGHEKANMAFGFVPTEPDEKTGATATGGSAFGKSLPCRSGGRVRPGGGRGCLRNGRLLGCRNPDRMHHRADTGDAGYADIMRKRICNGGHFQERDGCGILNTKREASLEGGVHR